ncbi:RagB/SusD family nutrient uptake outer membrane protein [Segetibacter koreensis]|uniref:RagB/SusD family nutrient uptake outer membrane protein n=1 Tax=Segetibacter koreensis TaxID=398037 RepID=UPI00036E3B23|nr:RagB/SusD family nutrient uptake outer membrane protein [Segetibacter koreensis]
MRNNIVKLLILSSLIITSCSKELNTKPTTAISEAEALKTSSDVNAALVGAYTDFGASYFFGGRIFLEADLLGDNNEIDWEGTYQQLTQMHNKAIPVENTFVANSWLAGYTAINDANNVLSAVSIVDTTARDRVQGEAKFLRSASFFELVKMYAKDWNDGNPANNPGVPLVLTPTREITSESQVKRNTVAEVYQQVITDLTDAEAKLPAANGFFATKGAAAAMLARVYLQQGDYNNALLAADRSIKESVTVDGNPVELAGTFAAAFGEKNTPEDIFAVQVTNSSGIQGFNEFYSSAQRGDVLILDTHLNMYQPNDDRKNLFYTLSGSTYSGKFEQLYGNVHTIRLAEMLLVRAECNFRLGSSVGDSPLNDINKIRTRAKLTPLSEGQLTLNEILKERRLELAFEGFRLDDVKRLKENVGNLPWNSPKLIFPIPAREIRANPNLTQNEGY